MRLSCGNVFNQNVFNRNKNLSLVFESQRKRKSFAYICGVFIKYNENKWNVHFFARYELCLISIWTEAVLRMIEMNNEGNVYSLQNTRWSKYWDWNCIYQDKNEHWINL